MSKYEIVIYWSEEDNSFLAEVPELAGIMAHGETQDEALKSAQDAIEAWLFTAIEDGIEIPKAKGKLMYA